MTLCYVSSQSFYTAKKSQASKQNKEGSTTYQLVHALLEGSLFSNNGGQRSLLQCCEETTTSYLDIRPRHVCFDQIKSNLFLLGYHAFVDGLLYYTMGRQQRSK